jgi:hypothetical protein
MSGTAQIEVSLATFKAIEAARLSFGESHDDIVRRALAVRQSRSQALIRETARIAPPATRRRGNVSVGLFGRREAVANLKGGYIAILTALVRHKPSLFEHLAQEGRTRRRWIARTPEGLYADSPHLARDHAWPLSGDWFLDTNLSRAQIDQRLEVACRIAGYRYGTDLTLDDGRAG